MKSCLTEEDIAKIQKRHLHASPGPWKIQVIPGPMNLMYICSKIGVVTKMHVSLDVFKSEQEIRDAQFISMAWEDICSLIDEVKVLRQACKPSDGKSEPTK
mgnify:CR=1 FL=1